MLAKFNSRDDPHKPFLASMGIYLFNTKTLIDLLSNVDYDDFGHDVIPAAIRKGSVYGFDHECYWEDIGTIRSFYETNLSLARPNPPFNLYDEERPVYTHARFLPGSVINGASLHNVLLAEGCYFGRAEIEDAVIGLRSQLQDGVKIHSSIVMGADFYNTPEFLRKNNIPLGIGNGFQIEGAIIDKNACLGPDVIIRPFPRGVEIETEDYVIRDGIVVIPKSTCLPAGTVIAPNLAP